MDTVSFDKTIVASFAPSSGECVNSFVLRDDAMLFLMRPISGHTVSLPLDTEGSYFCLSLTSEPNLWTGTEKNQLTARKLHILRQPAVRQERQIEFASPVSLAILIYFSERWCNSCPQGPSCQVAQFLLRGNDRKSGSEDQRLDLDQDGLSIAQALLNLRSEDEDVILSIEQSVLALLSWAFAKSKFPDMPRRSRGRLNSRATIKTRQAADIVRQRLDDPPTIVELSNIVGLNESDLKRCFKCLYGSGVAGYSRRKRLEAARDLLQHSALGVAAIALEVGYSNPSQFARAFRLHFGSNPSDYRRTTH